MLCRVLQLCLLGCFVIASDPVSGAVYRWTDESGTPHFSNRPEDVPPEFRHQLREGQDGLSETPHINVIEGLNRSGVADPGGETPQEAPDAVVGLAGEGLLGAALERLPFSGTTAIAVGLVVACFSLFLLLAFTAGILLLACRVCGEESPGFPRALAIGAAQGVAGFATGFLMGIVVPAGLAASGGALALNTFVAAGILKGMHSESFAKAFVVTLVAILISMAIVVGVAVVLGGAAGMLAAFSA